MVTRQRGGGDHVQDLGLANDVNALYTGLLYLPWTIKPLWAPLLEMWGTKRRWVHGHAVPAGGDLRGGRRWRSRCPTTCRSRWRCSGSRRSCHPPTTSPPTVSTSASRTQKEQARYVGAQGIFWNAGRILATGAAGALHRRSCSSAPAATSARGRSSWRWRAPSWPCSACGTWRMLPEDKRSVDAPRNVKEAAATFADTLKTFFAKPSIWRMIIFVVLYRSGEGFLEKIGPLFMMAVARLGRPGSGQRGPRTHQRHASAPSGSWWARWSAASRPPATACSKTLLILCLTLNLPSAPTSISPSSSRPAWWRSASGSAWRRVGWGFGIGRADAVHDAAAVPGAVPHLPLRVRHGA